MHNLESGLNCVHYHRVKQEELCILLRAYHGPAALYTLLKSVLGKNDSFKDFVYQHYKEVSDVGDFAALANMSVRTFQRRFKSEFKRPVHEWLNERRAERILHELRNTDKSLTEIGTSCGFGSASYFTTFCKQYLGMKPSDLRRAGTSPVREKGVSCPDIPKGGGF